MSDYAPEHRAGGDREEPIVGDAPPRERILFSNNAYDILKWVAQVLLPALALFYISVAPYWGLPRQEEVAGTVVALDLLLGTLLGLSSRQYANSDARYDGAVVISPNEDGNSDLNVSLNPQALAEKREITVRVNRV